MLKFFFFCQHQINVVAKFFVLQQNTSFYLIPC